MSSHGPEGPVDDGGPLTEEEQLERQINERLQQLYRRARGPIDDPDVRYYQAGQGYHGQEEAEPDQGETFGLALVGLEGDVHGAGAWEQPFALQSISKVFAYLLALEDHGRQAVLRRVGVEPSGDSFSSIAFDEDRGRPYNPMVNAGALVTADLIQGATVEDRSERVVALMRRYAGNDDLHVDEPTFAREMEGADRNRGTAYLLRSQHMIEGRVDDVLALYLRQCSVTVTCRDLAVMAATLANGGVNPVTGARACERRHVRDVLTVMYTCGMYDYAGEWAFDVGVPAKSGVSGALLVPIPGKLGLGVFSPGLDSHGNSIRGVEVCQEISERLGLHVFASDAEDAVLGDPAVAIDG